MGQIAGSQFIDDDVKTYLVNWSGPTEATVELPRSVYHATRVNGELVWDSGWWTKHACPNKILVSCEKVASGGVMGRDLDLMGMYTKTDLSPGNNHNGRPIYANSHAKNFYYWKYSHACIHRLCTCPL